MIRMTLAALLMSGFILFGLGCGAERTHSTEAGADAPPAEPGSPPQREPGS